MKCLRSTPYLLQPYVLHTTSGEQDKLNAGVIKWLKGILHCIYSFIFSYQHFLQIIDLHDQNYYGWRLIQKYVFYIYLAMISLFDKFSQYIRFIVIKLKFINYTLLPLLAVNIHMLMYLIHILKLSVHCNSSLSISITSFSILQNVFAVKFNC